MHYDSKVQKVVKSTHHVRGRAMLAQMLMRMVHATQVKRNEKNECSYSLFECVMMI